MSNMTVLGSWYRAEGLVFDLSMWPAVALSIDRFWDKGEIVPWDDPDTGKNQGEKEQVFPGMNENVYKLSKFGVAISKLSKIWY